jgi:hypothetical protein
MKIRKLESTEIPHLKQQLQITQERLKSGPVLTSRKDIERKMKFEEVKAEYDGEEERHKKKSTLFKLCQDYEAALGKKQSSGEQFKTKYEQVLSKFGGDKTNPKFTEEMEKYAKSVHREVLDLDETIRSLKKEILPLQDSLQVFILP